MKTFRFLAGAAVCLAMTLMPACSSDDEPSPVVDANFLNSLTRGGNSVCYELESIKTYESIDNSKWKEFDIYEWVGWSSPAPGKLLIHDGKNWSPLGMFSSAYGFHPLYFPMAAYRKATGFSGDIYVARPFVFDMENNKLTCGYLEFDIQRAVENDMTLVYYEDCSPVENKSRRWKWIFTYKKADWDKGEIDNNPHFDTAMDACLGIIEMLRTQFGDSFDINKLLEPYVIFPDPIVSLDQLEEECRKKPEY